MNLVNFLKLNEEFYNFVDGKRYMQDHEYSIYKNPKGDDLRALNKEGAKGYRFLVDLENKDIYIFDKELLHMDALSKIKELRTVEARKVKEGMADTNRNIVWIKGITPTKKIEIRKIIKDKEIALTYNSFS